MFNLENYETVDERIHKFWADYPNGRIATELLEVVRGSNGEPLQYIVFAEVYKNLTDPVPSATGYAEEVVGSSPVNKQAALENAETSAIGRCLANMAYSTKGSRPSQTEMAKVSNGGSPLQALEREPVIPPSEWTIAPVKGSDTVIKQPDAKPSEKQLMALVNKTTKCGITSDFFNQFWQFSLAGGVLNGGNEINKGEASKLIGMDKTDFEGYAAAFFASLLTNDDSAPF